MLSARRKSDGQTVHAYDEFKANAPFFCLTCGDEVILRTGTSRTSHFAHANPLACKYGIGESELHRRIKKEIFDALTWQPNVHNLVLERPLGTVRPDISFYLDDVPVAIEVQISSLSVEEIMRRTIEYFRKGIYVLWLLPWTPKLDGKRYTPTIWEKWLHTLYFGRVYYWTDGLHVVDYSFEPSFKTIPQKTWYAKGRKVTAGGYSVRSKRYKTPVRGKMLNLLKDFGENERYWWTGNGVTVPDAKLYTVKMNHSYRQKP
jgi:competence protein CoiA